MDRWGLKELTVNGSVNSNDPRRVSSTRHFRRSQNPLDWRFTVVSIKIIRNKITGQPEVYEFVEFVSHATAERILQMCNGTQMPETEQTFRLNWASFGIGERLPDAGPEHSTFVGDLAPDVTDYLLQETFQANYPSVRGAKVVTDPSAGRSKGYGFVKLGDENERNCAMTEMNGIYWSTRPMRISAATPKKAIGYQQQYAAAKALYPAPAYTTPVQVVPADSDITNTTIFVGNLDPNATEEELRQYLCSSRRLSISRYLYAEDVVLYNLELGHLLKKPYKGCRAFDWSTAGAHFLGQETETI
ncbi:hypothetical protein GH714_039738 [Hevea brasiliensis]|uniref:RRM domain-containing protein n=1 Tax=Hevea brasiliensis TaxID=3981 RepID=A0A6A6MYT6_HEVBR|nr:hypothetical protein GH714_039738 [Hevea brasiliensis]